MSEDILVSVEGVSKKFCRSLKRSLIYGLNDLGQEILGRRLGGDGVLRKDEFWALRDVSFTLRRGECLGLIGRNGAGKSTILRMLNGLIKPDAGRIEMRGRVGALIALGSGFNPVLTGRENIFVNAAVLGFSRAETEKRFEEIVSFAEIGEFIDMPVRSYSSGMSVRLGFAIASALEPDILLLDEVLAVGDVGFRIKSYNRIFELAERTAVIFVTHMMPQVERLSTSVAYLQDGTIAYLGAANEGIDRYNRAFDFAQPEWHMVEAVSVSGIRINGQDNPADVYLREGEGLSVSFVGEFPSNVRRLEIALTVGTAGQDVIARLNSRFYGQSFQNSGEPERFCIEVQDPRLGSDTTYLSLAVNDADTSRQVFRAPQVCRVTTRNPVYLAAPMVLRGTISKGPV